MFSFNVALHSFCFQLKDGYFGRTDTSTCIEDSDPAVDPAEIPCQDVSVHDLDVVRDCDGRRQCNFDVTKDVLGINPCPSRTYPKYLNLTYNCISKSHIPHAVFIFWVVCYQGVQLVGRRFYSIISKKNTFHRQK